MNDLDLASTILDAFDRLRRDDPTAPAIDYYGNRISRSDLDDLSDGVAAWLANLDVGPGDRVAVSLQNTPAFAVALLATWKRGGVLVPVNPMLRTGELESILSDSKAKVLLAHPAMAAVVDAACREVTRPPTVLWSAPSDFAGHLAGPWDQEVENAPHGDATIVSVATDPRAPAAARQVARPQDLALLTYTSGTTGPSKGAMLTHANVAYQAQVTPNWIGLARADSVLTIAPFFHITGLGLHLALGLGFGLPLVMTYRFEPTRVLDLIDHYRPTFTVGTITAYIALAESALTKDAWRSALSSLSTAVSGGAAVPVAVVERYERDFGVYIRNGYGLTETASACVIVPPGEQAPVDPGSGATSIGRPLPGVKVTILSDAGTEAPDGVGGEVVLQGPQVGIGYWHRPDETAETFRADGLRTGDIGIIDENGWIYLVDRKKDLIVVSGYKVWPRDVEDVLYRHPAVAEAAVVGVPDEYRGESVTAFIVVRPGSAVTTDELNRHCRELLSAYKCPREYHIVETLPKSSSGKILRRLLKPESDNAGGTR